MTYFNSAYKPYYKEQIPVRIIRQKVYKNQKETLKGTVILGTLILFL